LKISASIRCAKDTDILQLRNRRLTGRFSFSQLVIEAIGDCTLLLNGYPSNDLIQDLLISDRRVKRTFRKIIQRLINAADLNKGEKIVRIEFFTGTQNTETCATHSRRIQAELWLQHSSWSRSRNKNVVGANQLTRSNRCLLPRSFCGVVIRFVLLSTAEISTYQNSSFGLLRGLTEAILKSQSSARVRERKLVIPKQPSLGVEHDLCRRADAPQCVHSACHSDLRHFP